MHSPVPWLVPHPLKQEWPQGCWSSWGQREGESDSSSVLGMLPPTCNLCRKPWENSDHLHCCGRSEGTRDRDGSERGKDTSGQHGEVPPVCCPMQMWEQLLLLSNRDPDPLCPRLFAWRPCSKVPSAWELSEQLCHGCRAGQTQHSASASIHTQPAGSFSLLFSSAACCFEYEFILGEHLCPALFHSCLPPANYSTSAGQLTCSY